MAYYEIATIAHMDRTTAPSPLRTLIALLLVCFHARAVELSTARIDGKEAIVCYVDTRKEKLELFLRDDAGQPLKSFEGVERWLAMSGRTLVWGMNAGMYHGDLSPVGLFAQNGKQIAPLNLDRGEGNFFLKPNGVFLLSASGPRVVESSECLSLPEPPTLATQSGPLLVRAGRIHPVFKPDSEFRLVRNGVGTPAPGIALFVITKDQVNLHQFARLFRDVLRCPDALYFDGTVSSLHAPELGRSDKLIDLGPIIGITATK